MGSKKLKMITGLFLFVAILGAVVSYKYSMNFSEDIDTQNDQIAIYLETEEGSETYALSDLGEFPESGYSFNVEKSSCTGGGTLSYVDNKVNLTTSKSEKCTLYFDKSSTFSSYIKSLYGKEPTLYLHDANLADSAQDGSYRYSGASDEVNNFVCFGSDADTCPEENLYRIIGVFGDKVKLIKKSSFQTYSGCYASSYDNGRFKQCDGYKILNETFYNSLSDIWKNFIHDYLWINSSIDYSSINSVFATSNNNKIYSTNFLASGCMAYPDSDFLNPAWRKPQQMFNLESKINNSENSKIGTETASEIFYSSNPQYWNNTIFDTNSWMFLKAVEHLYTSLTCSDTLYFHVIYADGTLHAIINGYGTNIEGIIRPTFYLAPTVNYISGTGTLNNPYRIN